MSNIDVFQLCSMILTKLGFENESLLSLTRKWKAFVEECVDCYNWDYSEYRNEIRARYLIQQLLDDERVSNSSEFADLFAEIETADTLFRSILLSGVVLDKGEYWWDVGVLKRAGEAYCLYMYDAHQITVENAEV